MGMSSESAKSPTREAKTRPQKGPRSAVERDTPPDGTAHPESKSDNGEMLSSAEGAASDAQPDTANLSQGEPHQADLNQNGEPPTDGQAAPVAAYAPPTDLNQLMTENGELRQFAEQLQDEKSQLRGGWERGIKETNQTKEFLEQARRRLEQMEKAVEQAQKRERQLESLIEEKSETVAQLEQQITELRKKVGGAQGVLSEEELLEIQRQLEQERTVVQQERTDMEEEFKRSELTMSRERAEVARQRKEIESKKREIELLIDAALRDERLKHQMSAILDLQNEIKGKGMGSGRPSSGRIPVPASPSGFYSQPAPSAGPAPATAQSPAESLPPLSPPQGTAPASRPSFIMPPPPPPVQPVAVPPPPADPAQYIPPELSQDPNKARPPSSLFRRFFKGGQQ